MTCYFAHKRQRIGEATAMWQHGFHVEAYNHGVKPWYNQADTRQQHRAGTKSAIYVCLVCRCDWFGFQKEIRITLSRFYFQMWQSIGEYVQNWDGAVVMRSGHGLTTFSATKIF